MALATMRNIALHNCFVASLLVGSLLWASPLVAQPASSVGQHDAHGVQVPLQQALADVLRSDAERQADGEVGSGAVAMPAAAFERGASAQQPTQSRPQTLESPDLLYAVDSYEQRLAGMRLSTVLSRRPVLALDPVDPPSSVLVDAVENEVPRRWIVDMSDATLRQTLLRWSDSIGWQLIWEADKDFVIDARVELNTTFKNALETVMLSLADSAYPLQVSLNRDVRIARVQRYMEQRAR